MKYSFLTCLLAGVLFLVAFPQKAQARVIIKERTTFYNVSGKNGAALFKSIRRRGPKLGKSRHAIATTTSQISVKNVKTRVTRRRCSIKSVDVILNLTYRYPRWKNKRRASPAVRKAWNRFIARARTHEQMHGKIAKDHARGIDRAMRRISGRVSRGCKNFGSGAKKKFQRLARSAKRKHQRFDRREGRARSRSTRLQVSLYKAR